MNRNPKCGSGFTLIELVVSLAILALIATMAAPMGEVIVQRNKEQDLRKSLRLVRDAIDAYKQAYDDGRVTATPVVGATGYPPTLQVLEDGVEDVKSPTPKKIFFLRRIPADPFAEPGLSPAETWGLRSYSSSAKNPNPGEDVFDIYSKSEAKGLNGVPYKEW
ncbi:MAG: type II secretion system protein [Methylophilaceae bacterium]